MHTHARELYMWIAFLFGQPNTRADRFFWGRRSGECE